jgi:hypothetical protein
MSFVSIVTALVTVAQNVVPATFDGAPDHIPPLPSNYAVIGSAVAAPTSTGQPTEFFIGDKTQREEYDLVCYAHAESGDTSIAWCRNSVWTTYSAIAQAVQADPTLGGVLLSESGWIVAAGFDYTQTSDEDLNDPDVTTRFAHIDFRFTVSHLLQLS